METKSIAKNLVYQRKLKGYTQEELSGRTEVTVRTIQRIEKGDVSPHLQTVRLLATALDIEVKDLLPLENPKEENIQKKWLLLLHSIPFLGFIIPLANILVPLFLWIHKREDNKLYDIHGAKVINFQISMSLLYILSFIALVTIEKWGFFLFIAVIPFSVIVMLYNIMKVVKTHKCYYPLAFPFIKASSGRPSSTPKTLLLILMSSILFTSCNGTEEQGIQRLDGTVITKDSLDYTIESLVKLARVQGLAIAIFNNKQPVYQNIVGYKDFQKKSIWTDSTNVYGASLSKAVFSVLVMKLVEDKVIDLDTPLESYLPKKIYEYKPLTRWHDNYSDLKTDSLYHKITARMCLAHTSGFANWRFFESDQKLKVNGIPGTKYGYSGEGFVYLQVVLEKITGKGLEELAQEIIFEPLQMKNSSYEWQTRFEKDFAYGHLKNGNTYDKDIDNEPRGGSTLETTAGDYIKFLTAVLNQEILSKASYDEIFKPQIRIHSLKQFGPDAKVTTDKYDEVDLSYGLGWGYLKTPYGKGVFKEGHGDGFQHYSILFPEKNIGVLLISNSDNAESIFKKLLEITIGDEYTPWEWENYIPYTKN